MTATRHALLAMLVVAAAAAPALAIELGDPAPQLKVKEWVKGEAVDLKAGAEKNIYVIEFWATWCSPCIRGIPHLTELQKKYKNQGVVVVGISSGEPPEVVKKFVEKMGDKMGYVVAIDEKDRSSKAYMEAFNKKGIPQVFVVDKKGKIVWEGHPMFGLDEVVARVVSNEYDVKSLLAISDELMKHMAEKQELLKKYLQLVSTSKDAEGAKEMGEALLTKVGDDADLLNGLSWTVLTADWVQTRDLDLALRAAKVANDATHGENPAILDTYARALWDTGKKSEAVKYQKKAVELAASEPMKAELAETLKKYEKEL